jgi:hypothetical protein
VRKVPRCRQSIEVESDDPRAVQAPRQLVFDDRAGAERHVIDHECRRAHPDNQPIPAIERRKHLMARGDGVGAEVAGRWIRVDLPDCAPEQLQEFLDERAIIRQTGRIGHRFVCCAFGSVINACRSDRHLAFWSCGDKLRQKVRRRHRHLPHRREKMTLCAEIKTLTNFEPPATEEEIRASALQFVRKLSGMNRPSRANEQAFNQAVEEVTAVASRLVRAMTTSAPPRNREEEIRKARERARLRFA